jgi:hypothetical protein
MVYNVYMKFEGLAAYAIVLVMIVGILIVGSRASSRFATEINNRQQAAAAAMSDDGVVK